MIHSLLQTLIEEKQNAVYALFSGNAIALVFFDLPFIGKIALGLFLSIVSGGCIKLVEFGLHEVKAYRLGNDSIFAKVKK